MLIVNSKKKLFIAYFYCYLFILSSTVFLPYRKLYISLIFLISFIGYLLYSFNKREISNKSILIVGSAILIFFSQSILFNTFPVDSFIRFIMMWLLPLFLVSILGINYIHYLINILYVIAIISFVFLIPSYLFPNFHASIGNFVSSIGTDVYLKGQNFFIYTWEAKINGLIRNSGNFTEPGYFGGILTFCLGFNLYFEKITSKKNLVFIAAMLSTFSTATYICLLILIYGYYITKEKRIFFKILFIPILIIISVYIYTSLDFMQEKIESHYENQYIGDVQRGRLGNFKIDLESIKENPFFGRGLVKGTRFENEQANLYLAPSMNSLSGLFAKYGVIFASVYLFIIFQSIKNICHFYSYSKLYKYPLFIALLLSAFSQPMLFVPTYMSLFFIPKLRKNKNENIRNYP